MEIKNRYQYKRLHNLDFNSLTIKLMGLFKLRPNSNDWFAGFAGSTDFVEVLCWRDLTQDEKKLLDVFMSNCESGCQSKSMEGYTVFEIGDVVDAWNKLEKRLGLHIEYLAWGWPDHAHLQIWIKGVLSDEQKCAVIQAYTDLIEEKTCL